MSSEQCRAEQMSSEQSRADEFRVLQVSADAFRPCTCEPFAVPRCVSRCVSPLHVVAVCRFSAWFSAARCRRFSLPFSEKCYHTTVYDQPKSNRRAPPTLP